MEQTQTTQQTTTQMPPASTTSTVVSSSSNKSTKMMIAMIFAVVILIFVVAILYILWQGNNSQNPAVVNTPVSSAQNYEPQNLNFDKSDGASTIDQVINDTDKSMVTTTKDSNFKDLDLQNDFQIK